MELNFDTTAIEGYHSASQVARILTEKWVADNMFCPRCGSPQINHFQNNRPVADFYCPDCSNEYELKSKNGALGHKVMDGAYDTMIKRITGHENPDFFFMSYSRKQLCVTDFLVIPKHFFVPGIIEKRKPLADTARRAGWVGCNIRIDQIPEQGRIYIIAGGKIKESAEIIQKVNRSNALMVQDIHARGWLLDVLKCVNRLDGDVFSLADVYAFEGLLGQKHPQNHHVRPKIRQQLQLLRDKGFIDFLGHGMYRKTAAW